MVKLKIDVNNDLLLQLQNELKNWSDGVLPKTQEMTDWIANDIAEQWREFAATRRSLPGVEPLAKPSRSYLEGVKVIPLGPFDYKIVNDSKMAEQVENGSPELDMKKTHPYGPRSRVSKKGVPYLIIPFRWGTPDTVGFKNVMPVTIYKAVVKYKKMETLVDAVNSDYKTSNAKREMVGRAQYNQGYGRLKGDGYGNMNGMVRSTDDTGIDRSGGYFTFRIISAKSPAGSWIKPAVRPRPVTQVLAEINSVKASTLIDSSLKEDIANL